MKPQYIYKARLRRVVDGDTVDLDGECMVVSTRTGACGHGERRDILRRFRCLALKN